MITLLPGGKKLLEVMGRFRTRISMTGSWCALPSGLTGVLYVAFGVSKHN